MPVSSPKSPSSLSIEIISQFDWSRKKAVIKQSITWGLCQMVRKEMKLTQVEFVKVLNVKPYIYTGYKTKGVLSHAATDKVLAVIDLFDFGLTIFGDIEKFLKWLRQRNAALNGERPIDVLQYNAGIHEVRILIDLFSHK